MRHAARRDANEAAILSGVEALGGLWLPGPPLDGWLYARGTWHLVEVKDPRKEGWKSEFTPEQILLLARLNERHVPYAVLRTEDDVLRLFGARRSA
jgi:hypothetical protein